MYKIEKGVPFIKGKKKTEYPWIKMEAGDSFFVPLGDKNRTEVRTRIQSAAAWAGARNKMKFSIRNENDGFRVWRIA